MKMSNLKFTLMVNVGMPIRNFFMPPAGMLSEVEIKPGDQILDYGCGPGTFSMMMAEKTGGKGVVHALDIHPRAVKMVEKKAGEKGLSNIRTILSPCDTALDDQSLDLAVCFDVFHMLGNPHKVLCEIHRVLKPDGVLYFSDHHMNDADINKQLARNGLFGIREKNKKTLSLEKQL